MRSCSGRAGQHVAGELLDRELIERHVGVEGVDDPIAIRPDRARPVLLVAVGVGVAGQVEPAPRPALAVMRRSQQSIDQRLVGSRRWVVDEGVDLFGRRRQADQVEVQPPGQRVAIGLGRGCQACRLDPGQGKVIDRVARPGGISHRGQGCLHGGSKAQWDSYLAPCGDPGPQGLPLLVGQWLVGGGRRHLGLGIDRHHPMHQLAFVRLAGHDRPLPDSAAVVATARRSKRTPASRA